MSTIKSYTYIEQSRKLADILPLESADMFYDGVQDLYKEKVYNIPIDGSSITVRTGHTITEKGIKANLLLPAWSLAALLCVLPNGIVMNKDAKNGRYHFSSKYIRTYVTADNPVDACFEMILKLHERKML